MSMGLCLNKSANHRLSHVLEPLNMSVNLDADPEIYWGGPISRNTVWMLHDRSWNISSTIAINDNWSVTSHHQMFYMLSEGAWPEHFRVIIGHCGWGPGQLEKELLGQEPWDHDHSWLTVKDPSPAWLIDCDPDQMWTVACSYCGNQAVENWLS
jgi:putative transcriptional regulator